MTSYPPALPPFISDAVAAGERAAAWQPLMTELGGEQDLSPIEHDGPATDRARGTEYSG